jgi:virginiamycin B lyase
MSARAFQSLMVAVLLCSVAPAWSQAQDQSATALPEGNGKEIVETACGFCHSLNTVINTGHSPEEWKTVMHMMVNIGSPVPEVQFAAVTDYLAKNFPEKPLPPAVVIPGNVEVSIQEWVVPTPGSRPHDPMAAPDGSLWYAGQMANVLGRVDPRTGEIKEYHLKTPNSGPHGLIPDKEGNVWFTANFKSYIGKLDPKTGDVTEYPMPDPKARDPHTLLMDENGTIWFTVQSANMVGKLTPATGEVKLVTVPTPKARPYGMVIDSKGVPFFVEFGSNKVASIDPETMQIHEFVLPNEKSRPRRVAITPDDVLWYADYSRGYLGRLDTKTGEVKEWASPGGPQSQPYGITAIGNIIWYSESHVKPNTVVRFDTKTEKFQTWEIPSGGGVVRNMVHTADGNLVLACSGVNRVALVRVKGSAKSGEKVSRGGI